MLAGGQGPIRGDKVDARHVSQPRRRIGYSLALGLYAIAMGEQGREGKVVDNGRRTSGRGPTAGGAQSVKLLGLAN